MDIALHGAASADEATVHELPANERQDGLRLPADWRLLGNWLLCWVLLPNAGYWTLWIVGGPPRGLPILVTGLVGLAVHRAPFAARFAAFAGAMIYSGLDFISAMFNLSVGSLLYSLEFAGEMRPGASVEYLVGAAAVAATLVAGWRLLRLRTTLVEPAKVVLAALLTLMAASADAAMSEGRRGSYKRIAEPGTAFASATARSGFARAPGAGRHLVLIRVEAMGEPTDPAVRRRLLDIWAPPSVRARYRVATGSTPFYGSTTSGEMRELCGRWGDYPEVVDARDAGCLPARLSAAGYRSEAWHSFDGSFFQRTDWYPNIGFGRMRFGPDLIAGGAGRCPGVFPGACDRDVPRQLAGTLKAARTPTFLYWLTVNSHLPVIASERLRTRECASFDPGLQQEFPMTCRLMQLYDQTGRALAHEITAADFPDADILIVGDHLPPFFDRRNREQFMPDRVPWIMLSPKA